MKINKKQFLVDVAHEIKSLKEHATKKELAKLDLGSLRHDKIDTCIYGQMTGDCNSKRAVKLLKLGCVRITRINPLTYSKQTYSEVKYAINGVPNDDSFNGRRMGWVQRLSMLEIYIGLKDAKLEHIIDYLKDESGTLELKL